MTEYTWEVESLDCVPDGKVVSCIHWRVKGNNGTNTAEVYGLQHIEHNTKNLFTVYEALNKEEVIRWAKEAMGEEQVASLYASLDNQLETLANPPVVSLPLPWANNA
jgi:hypothetical protein